MTSEMMFGFIELNDVSVMKPTCLCRKYLFLRVRFLILLFQLANIQYRDILILHS